MCGGELRSALGRLGDARLERFGGGEFGFQRIVTGF
jgi:hypothetical protein